jgi:hypothetical protein
VCFETKKEFRGQEHLYQYIIQDYRDLVKEKPVMNKTVSGEQKKQERDGEQKKQKKIIRLGSIATRGAVSRKNRNKAGSGEQIVGAKTLSQARQ